MSKNSKVNPGHNGTGKGKGHVEHGNGNGYGHDKHHAPAPPPAPNFADGVVTLVSAGGTSTFASITEALAAAVAGDTLQVGAGVYKEVFTLNADVTIIGEKGAVIDGSGFQVSTGLSGTIELGDGADGATLSGLKIIAIQGGAAVTNEFGVEVNGVELSNNVFDAGANTSGALVYLNPDATNIDILRNTFEGSALVNSPLLGLDVSGAGDADIDVIDNIFGETASAYAEVEIFNAAAGEVLLSGNTGLDTGDIAFGTY